MTQVIKITGPQMAVNSTPNTVPTDAANGYVQNTGPAPYGANTYNNSGVALGTVGGATCVRILNVDSGLIVITVANSAGVNVGSFTIASMEGEYLRKGPYDTIASNSASGANVLATPIALTH
jgi:hypothetical protein